MNYVETESKQFVWERGVDGMWVRDVVKFSSVPKYTSSIDAAVSLAERVLPGWFWGITQGSDGNDSYEFQGNVWPGVTPFPAGLERFGYHRSPAIALVLAILRALQQKGSSNG